MTRDSRDCFLRYRKLFLSRIALNKKKHKFGIALHGCFHHAFTALYGPKEITPIILNERQYRSTMTKCTPYNARPSTERCNDKTFPLDKGQPPVPLANISRQPIAASLCAWCVAKSGCVSRIFWTDTWAKRRMFSFESRTTILKHYFSRSVSFNSAYVRAQFLLNELTYSNSRERRVQTTKILRRGIPGLYTVSMARRSFAEAVLSHRSEFYSTGGTRFLSKTLSLLISQVLVPMLFDMRFVQKATNESGLCLRKRLWDWCANIRHLESKIWTIWTSRLYKSWSKVSATVGYLSSKLIGTTSNSLQWLPLTMQAGTIGLEVY